jgi:hypothetical protein
MGRSSWVLLAVLAAYLALAAWQLRALPGEWFGDISILHEEVVDILKNPWDWKFNLSAGPVYHDLVAGLAAFLGPNFLTYKIASVLTGLAGLVLTYLLGKEVWGEKAALWGTALMGTSYWYLVWARLGSSPQILAPVLVAGSLWLSAQWLRTRRWPDLVLAEVIACLGLWTYPALFTLPLLPVIIGISRQKYRAWIGTMVVLVVAGGLFYLSVRKQPDLFASGYIGEKVWGGQVSQVGVNLIGQVRGWIDRGEPSTRVNIPSTPHVDPITAGLMTVGWVVLFWGSGSWRGGKTIKTNKTDTGWMWVAVMVLLLLPSSSPAILPGEIPSSGRTFGVAPLVFLIAGFGLEKIRFKILDFRFSKIISQMIATFLLFGIGAWNVYRYFWVYPTTLPNQNAAPGWEVARWLDTLPPGVPVKLTACCWGENGEAEPKGILYQMKNQAGRENIIHEYPFVADCSGLELGKTYALVFAPTDTEIQERFKGCAEGQWVEDFKFVGFVGRRGNQD